jgi:hypothetical protein
LWPRDASCRDAFLVVPPKLTQGEGWPVEDPALLC